MLGTVYLFTCEKCECNLKHVVSNCPYLKEECALPVTEHLFSVDIVRVEVSNGIMGYCIFSKEQGKLFCF